jgi:hypothetical protein
LACGKKVVWHRTMPRMSWPSPPLGPQRPLHTPLCNNCPIHALSWQNLERQGLSHVVLCFPMYSKHQE